MVSKGGKKKSTKKTENTKPDIDNAIYAVGLVAISYGIGSLAIDNGSLIFYVAAFACIYWAVHYGKQFVRPLLKR